MGYLQAQSEIGAANLADDAAKIAYANAVTYTWRSYFVSYRTFRDLFAKAVADAAAVAIGQADPNGLAIFMAPGDELGNGGGANVANPDSQAMLAALVTATILTQDQANRILDLARTSQGPRYQQWGLSGFDANTLTNLADRAAWETMSRDVDSWLNVINNNANAVAVMLGVTADVLAARRDAMVGVVQQWKVAVESNRSIAAMPVNATAAWAATV